ncbi:MAG TPA: anthranilate phosphoribosyltransferase [Gammaproteobacteria bacterium]|jgi:anthranilate phosphoribosyltransferase
MTREILEQLIAGQDLTQDQAADLLRSMASGEVEPAAAGALLTALRIKGEAATEIRGFAVAMRELARHPVIPRDLECVDIVGTGGDGSGSLNLSTGSALLAAAAGLKVVKHGNRSISSQSGSADVLASLGLPMPLDESAAARCLEQTGFTFLFAPHYHPAMKHIAPVRQALGVRTIFNVLGPLVNPAEPPFHVLGAASEQLAQLMAEAIAEMPIKRAFVVHGAAGWDEATPIGPFVCFDVAAGNIERQTRDPSDFGIARCAEADLLGGTPEQNASRLDQALRGEDTAAHRDALVTGAALALEVTGAAADFALAIERARLAIDDGSAARLLDSLASFTAAESAADDRPDAG